MVLGEEKIKMSQKMQGKNISVGNNMRAKNSEYTCANSQNLKINYIFQMRKLVCSKDAINAATCDTGVFVW